MSKTPYIGFGSDTLDNCEFITEGKMIKCPQCGEMHRLEGAENSKGEHTDLLLFYKCGDTAYLGALDNRLVINVKVDCSGELEDGNE